MSLSLRVLIIDGHLAVGRGLKALVDEMPGLHVVGLCTRGERGLAQAATAAPDVALVDAELPGLSSAAVIRLLRWRLPKTRIVALGIYPERQRAALDAGAHDFVLKDAGYEALWAAIAGPCGDAAPPGMTTAMPTPLAPAQLAPGVGVSGVERAATHGAVGNEERVTSCH
jgi:DNA-binding NarL/FixJ family response regulator